MTISSILSLDFAKILSYGLPGLSFIFILLAYLLLRKEQDQKAPRGSILKGIYVFLGCTFGMAILVGVFSLPILNANTRLNEAVEIAEDVTSGFVKLSTSDSLTIVNLKQENEYLKGKVPENQEIAYIKPNKLELERYVQKQEQVLSQFENNSTDIKNSNPEIKLLKTQTALLKRKILLSDFNALGKADKTEISKEVSQIQKKSFDLSQQIRISEKALLVDNLKKFDSIHKTLK